MANQIKSNDNIITSYGIPPSLLIGAEEARRSLLQFTLFTKEDYQVNWCHELLCKELDAFLVDDEYDRLMIFLPPRRGKALCVKTPIFTSEGWKTIETLKVGDIVFDENHKECEVLAKSEVFKNRLSVRMSFITPDEDSEDIVADMDHEWPVYHPLKQTYDLLDTREIFYTILNRRIKEYRASDRHFFANGEIVKADTQCIQVSSKSHLFLAGKLKVPTHNSEIVSRRLPAYALGKFPDMNLIACSYGAELASRMNRDVQRIIDSPKYGLVFPETKLNGKNVKKTSFGNAVRTSDFFEVVGKRGSYRSAGVGNAITGMGADLCFESFTRVLTPIGYTYIKDLNVGDLVWSYNHERNSVELKSVKAIRSRAVSSTLKITTLSGSKIICTPDHPFWTKERGYQEARNLKSVDTLIKAAVCEDKDNVFCSKVLPMWETLRQKKSRVREVIEKGSQGFLLLKTMFKSSPCCEKLKEMSNLQESNTKNKKVLLKRVSSNTSKVSPYRMPVLQYNFSTSISSNKVLLKVLQGLSPLNSNGRTKQSQVQRWYSKYIPSFISQDETNNIGKRFWSMLSVDLSIFKKFTCASYKREQRGQYTRESDNSLSQVPHGTPQVSCDSISRIERDSKTEVTVYDITVEGNHNFFAENILVHNCIIDDPFKDWRDATSATIQQAVYDWYTSTLLTRLSKNGKVILMHTRWAAGDLAGRLLEEMSKGEGDKWKIISLPEILDDETKKHPEDPRSEGEVLWPERFPLDKVLKTMKAVGSKVWAALFQQNPIADGGNLVKRTWFKYYTALPEVDYKLLSFDFTFKGNDDNDFVAGLCIGVKGANKYVFPYVVHERLNFTGMLSAMKSFYAMYPDNREVLVEEKANGAAIIDTLKDHIEGIIAINPTDSKDVRLASITPEIEAGNVFLPDPLEFPEAAAWVELFIQEFVAFPRGKNDDFVDALTQALRRIKESRGMWEDKLREYYAQQEGQGGVINAREKEMEDAVKKIFGWK